MGSQFISVQYYNYLLVVTQIKHQKRSCMFQTFWNFFKVVVTKVKCCQFL